MNRYSYSGINLTCIKVYSANYDWKMLNITITDTKSATVELSFDKKKLNAFYIVPKHFRL